MMTLMIGGSGSGKSARAEDYLAAVSEGKQKYYIATMRVYDEEGEKKIERHRRFRSGKGFITIEQPTAIQDSLDKMESETRTESRDRTEPGEKAESEYKTEPGERTALLECISNLAANEMFSGEEPTAAEAVTERVVEGIRRLKEGLAHLVVVSNNVFEDGIVYDETTMEYIQAMGQINEKLAAMAERVVEVVAGIPVVIREAEED